MKDGLMLRSIRTPGRRPILAITLAHALVIGLPATAQAKPDPVKQLQQIREELEKLGEQANGLKVRLTQAQRAAKVATANAKRQQNALTVIQKRIGSMAAENYMRGGADPTMTFATAADPQVFLDQAATVSYFAAQDGTKVMGLLQTMQAAQRTKKSAQDRADQVLTLQNDLKTKIKTRTALYSKIRDRVTKAKPEKIKDIPPVAGSGKGPEAVKWALTQLGKPYVWGADGPDSFDCSGLTMWAYAKVGISLPHYTGSQWNAGAHVSREALQPGDLVFFYGDLHHMGMYIGNGQMVHAPHTGDVVKIAPIAGRPWAGAVRVA
jgi:cell wall-associated NlpC family hydrolase